MASHGSATITALGVVVIAAGVGGYLLWRSQPSPPVVGVVRTTEVRVAPEVSGQLAASNDLEQGSACCSILNAMWKALTTLRGGLRRRLPRRFDVARA